MNQPFKRLWRVIYRTVTVSAGAKRGRFVVFLMIAMFGIGCSDPGDSARDVARPSRQKRSAKPSVPKTFDIHVLIENSLSMHGYVKGVTSFEVALMRLLRQMHQASYRSTMSLSYVNSEIYPVFANAAERDIDHYITNVEPATFGDQGDRANTNLRHVINTALQRVTSNSVVLLVSDMILSPGRDVSSADFLEQEKAAIQYDLQAFMKQQPSLTLLAMQLYSEFNGQYYVEYSEQRGERITKSKPLIGRMTRPYYVWMLGPRDLVSQIAGTLRIEELRANGLRNVGMIAAAPVKVDTMAAAVVSRQSIGRTGRRLTGKYVVRREHPRQVGRVELDVSTGSVDWVADVRLPLDMRLMNDSIEVRSTQGVHQVRLVSATKLSPTSLRVAARSTWHRGFFREDGVRIRLLQRPPGWFFTSGNVDDRRTLTDDTMMQTTFGLNSLMTGAWAAIGGNDPRLGWTEISFTE